MDRKNLLQINLDLCTGCGACVIGCPENALLMKSNGPALRQPLRCSYCTDCEDLCPVGAVRAPFSFRWAKDA
jgi:ferredoxin